MPEQSLGFLPSAERVLRENSEPLHYAEITKTAIDRGWLHTTGRTPEATMVARLATSINREGDTSPFVRVSPGIYGLRVWAESGDIEILNEQARSLVPHYPRYEHTRLVLRAWEGVNAGELSAMRSAISELSGTPQEIVDWTDPDSWIAERLEGRHRELAKLTWETTDGKVNPRYLIGHWYLADHYRLLEISSDGTFSITEAGEDFIRNPTGKTVRRMDQAEGLLAILKALSELGPSKRADILGEWGHFLEAESRIRSDSAAKSFLWARLRNLSVRGLVEREGAIYDLASQGLSYLEDVQARTSDQPETLKLRRLARDQRREVREALRETLQEIDPFAFEHVIQRLLQELGYEDVEVTAKSGDKGVDVVANIQLGITTVREVVQVKRQAANVHRPVLDALRGSLHRWGAVRGTIITTSGFAKGTKDAAFDAGAAPITLIDGERLLDLLIENGIGVSKRNLELWELDPSNLVGSDEDE